MKATYLLKFICGYIKKYTSSSSILLDVGCGRGQYAICTKGWYIGTDITASPYNVDSPRKVTVISYAEFLPFADASIDVIMTVACFYQIADPVQALSEFQRVLKPQGRILLFDYNRRTQKRLTIAENRERPCWTHNQLLKIIRDAGFDQCERLIPSHFFIPKWFSVFLFPLLEHFGIWAIVTGVKANTENDY